MGSELFDSWMDAAYRDGVEDGIAQGEARGETRGEARGIEKGMEKGMARIVSGLVANGTLGTSQIAEATGIPLPEIEAMAASS